MASTAKDGVLANVTKEAERGIDMGGWGSAEVLRIDLIQIDPDYQRDLRHDLINKIGQEYDLVKAGPILISQREDGSLWAVDGQHRMLGAKQAGEEEIFANVIHGLTKEKEAELRLARNDRRADTIYEKFRTRIVMGDPKAHRMVEIVRQQGTDINLTPSTASGINGIQTCEVLYDIDKQGTWLGRTIRCIKDAFGEDDLNPDTLSSSMLKSVAWFLAQHVDSHEITYQAFVERLGAHDVHDIRRKAVSHKAVNGGALWINFYRSLVEVWNFRRQEKHMIRAKTIGSIASLGEAGSVRGGWDIARDRTGGGGGSGR